MAEWFVARNGQQQGPASIDTLRTDARAGRLAAGDLCWREGLSEWLPASNVPELAGAFAASGQVQLAYQQPAPGLPTCTERTLTLFGQTAIWVRIFGVLMLIGAAISLIGGVAVTLLSILGLFAGNHGGNAGPAGFVVLGAAYVLLAFVYLFPGIYLNRYASRINALVRLRREDLLEQAVEAQKSFWKFLGVAVIVSFALWLLAIVAGIVIAAIAASSGSGPRITP